MSTKTFPAFFDRVEGGQAILLLGKEEREVTEIASKYLPEGARPGSVLCISISEDTKETAELQEETRQMIDLLSIHNETSL